MMWRLNTAMILMFAASSAAASGLRDGGVLPFGTFGFDVSGMDASMPPGESFFGYADGKWAARTQIPAGHSQFGVLSAINLKTRTEIGEVLPRSSIVGRTRISDMYASYMDERTREAKGARPIQNWLSLVGSASDKKRLATVLGVLQTLGVQGLVDVEIAPDPLRPSIHVARLHQSGLQLPGPDYYTGNAPELVAARSAYRVFIEHALGLSGGTNFRPRSEAVLAFETKLAAVHWTNERKRDARATYNPTTVRGLATENPGFDWLAYGQALGLSETRPVVVNEPSALSGASEVWGTAGLPVLRDWVRVSLISQFGPYLSKNIADEHSRFFDVALQGVTTSSSREDHAIRVVSQELKDDVSQAYVQHHFSSSDRRKAQALVVSVKAAYRQMLLSADWLSARTRNQAVRKLDAAVILVGYPDRWRSYRGLRITAHDLTGNVARAERWEYRYQLRKLGLPVDRSEWTLDATSVGGWSKPELVNIGFPAAAIQSPVFDAAADPAVNYGAFGAIVGHEITHLFDDQGRHYDNQGRLKDWWKPEEEAIFARKASRLVEQYGSFRVLHSMRINGAATLGENLADLIGLRAALNAYRRSTIGSRDIKIGGFTGVQRFFLSFAQLLRTKYTDSALREMLLSDVHSPAEQRLDEVRNLDEWYAAFGIHEGEPLFLKPEDRVRMW